MKVYQRKQRVDDSNVEEKQRVDYDYMFHPFTSALKAIQEKEVEQTLRTQEKTNTIEVK